MMKHRAIWGIWCGLVTAMAAFRWVPGLAARWQTWSALPVLHTLHRMAAALPFPLLEPLVVIIVCLGLCRWRSSRAFCIVCIMYALLWYPAYWTDPVCDPAVPDGNLINQLCLDLIDELGDSALQFTSPFEEAGTVAGLPDAVVKPARYPEWMRALGIAGMFSPWTGEAIVDPDVDPANLPFTCVHELMHLRGIADEGTANVAAFVACTDHGGMFADSARLYTLRWALHLLREADPVAAQGIVARMDAGLATLITPVESPCPHPLARLLGIARQTTDYDRLIPVCAYKASRPHDRDASSD